MFARHLILQDYRPDQLTILTTYSGQMFKLRSVSQIQIYCIRIGACHARYIHFIYKLFYFDNNF